MPPRAWRGDGVAGIPASAAARKSLRMILSWARGCGPHPSCHRKVPPPVTPAAEPLEEPHSLGISAVSSTSLAPTGSPCSGPGSTAAAPRSAAASNQTPAVAVSPGQPGRILHPKTPALPCEAVAQKVPCRFGLHDPACHLACVALIALRSPPGRVQSGGRTHQRSMRSSGTERRSFTLKRSL